MFAVESSAVPEWLNFLNWWFPQSVNVNCPFCAIKVAFAPERHAYDPHRKTVASVARCPSCGQSVSIWVIDPGPANDSSKKGSGTVAMFPPPIRPRQPIPGATLMPPRVAKAYSDVLGVYNANVWSATATQVRRTLEGVLTDLLPADKRQGTLADQIRNLPSSVDLGKPLVTLADGIRQGGNLGAHFDNDKDPDQPTAEAMLDLIEYLIEYMYTLPGMIQQLHDRLAALDGSGTP